MVSEAPPIQDPIAMEGNYTPQTWVRWFQTIRTELDEAITSASVWGSVTGTLSDQTDLQDALDDKQNITRVIDSYSANTTLTDANDFVLCNASSAAFTVTLPAAGDFSNKVMNIKKTNTNANDVTIETAASEDIDGNTNLTLTGAGKPSVKLLSDGANWWIV